MVDKRSETRHRKRLKLRYGTEQPTVMGFTEDISEEGFFISTARIQPANTLLKIEITTPDNRKVALEGTVQWIKRVSPSMLRLGTKGGMGIKISRFVSGEEIYRELCESLKSRT